MCPRSPEAGAGSALSQGNSGARCGLGSISDEASVAGRGGSCAGRVRGRLRCPLALCVDVRGPGPRGRDWGRRPTRRLGNGDGSASPSSRTKYDLDSVGRWRRRLDASTSRRSVTVVLKSLRSWIVGAVPAAHAPTGAIDSRCRPQCRWPDVALRTRAARRNRGLARSEQLEGGRSSARSLSSEVAEALARRGPPHDPGKVGQKGELSRRWLHGGLCSPGVRSGGIGRIVTRRLVGPRPAAFVHDWSDRARRVA